MSFQGFAREEQFSTNQIKIDIDSVINKDLAEASRMSKFMAANAAMGEKWNTMYLNALIKKHDVEKKNRERNFKFFMDNRAKIQEQVKYNNKVKMEDAERSHPYIPSFMDMLQPALMKMAVDVGAKAIGKMFDDAAVAKKEAAAKLKSNTIQTMAGLAAEGSKEQLEAVSGGYFEGHERWSLEQQREKLDYFNSLGDYQAGAKSIALIHATNGLDVIDRQFAANSPQNTANNFNELARSWTSHQNGTDIGFHDLPNANPATFNTFVDEVKQAYIENVSPPGGLSAPVLGSVYQSIGKVVDQWRGRHDTQQYKQAVQDNTIQVIQAFDRAQTGQDRLNILTDPTGPFQSVFGGGPVAGMEFFFERIAPYQTAGQLQEMYNATGFQGKSMADEPKTYRSRRMQEAIRLAHNREAQSWASQEQQKSNLANRLADEILSGVYSDEWLNSQINNLQHGTDTEFGTMLAGMKPGDRNRITSALLIATGRDPNVQAVSTEVSTIDKAFSKSDKDKLASSVTLSTLVDSQKASAPLVKAALDDNPHKFRSVIDSWLSGIQERDDPRGEWNETQLANHIQAIISRKDDDYKDLQSILKPVVTEIDQETGQEVPAKVAYFPEVEKSIQNNAPKATGMSQAIALSANKSVAAARNDITKDQTMIEALTPFMVDLHNAQKAGADLRPILNRTPKVLTYLGSRSGKTGDSTQWINYFIEDHFTHMKPLSGDDLLTPEEAAEANSMWTGYNRMGNSMKQFVQGGHTYIPNAATNNISSGFASNRNIVPVPGTNITMNEPSANVLNGVIALGDELGINMRGAFTSGHRDNAKQQSLLDRWHAGDPDIVYKPAQPGNHPHGYGDTFDAGFTDKEKGVLKEYERRNPGIKFIQPVDGDWVHYQIIGTPQRQITPQQVIPVPSGIGLTPWTPEGNTPAQPSTGFSGIDTLLKHAGTEQGKSFSDTFKNHYQNQKG